MWPAHSQVRMLNEIKYRSLSPRIQGVVPYVKLAKCPEGIAHNRWSRGAYLVHNNNYVFYVYNDPDTLVCLDSERDFKQVELKTIPINMSEMDIQTKGYNFVPKLVRDNETVNNNTILNLIHSMHEDGRLKACHPLLKNGYNNYHIMSDMINWRQGDGKVGKVHSDIPLESRWIHLGNSLYRHNQELLQDLEKESGPIKKRDVDLTQYAMPTVGLKFPAIKHKVFDIAAHIDEHYDILTLNFWICLSNPSDAQELEYVLAVMDGNEVSDDKKVVAGIPGLADIDPSYWYLYEKQHKWAYRPHMKYGDAIIFDTSTTPHAALETKNITVDGQSIPIKLVERRSVDVRIIFFQKKKLSDELMINRPMTQNVLYGTTKNDN